MENASKALIMAGSVLLSLLIIGALVFMFDSLKGLKQTEATSEEVQKLAEYNKQIETFNRSGLYGSEVLSLANLITDYNKRQADLKGYQEIKLTVKVKADKTNKIMTLSEYNNETLIDNYTKLENAVKSSKSGGKEPIVLGGSVTITAEKAAGMKNTEIKRMIAAAQKVPMNDSKVEEVYENDVFPKIENYLNLKTELTQFKNKKFKEPKVEYDKHNGRVIAMAFEEVTL